MSRLSFGKQIHLKREILEPRCFLTGLAFVPRDLECCGRSAESIFSADLDGDGDTDLLAGEWNQITWRENLDGRGNFGEPQSISRDANGHNSVDVIAADVDLDGDLDVLSASFRLETGNQNSSIVAWYENDDGAANFGTRHVISQESNGANSISTGDLDADGDLDILVSSQLDGKILWHENLDGIGGFSKQRVITEDTIDPSSVSIGDIDGDGDLDVLSASFSDGKIAWYENLDQSGTFSEQRLITRDASYARSVVAKDLDGDGDLDVLSASGRSSNAESEKVAWYENVDGKGSFGDQQMVSSQHVGTFNAQAVDIDGDDDFDIVATSFGDNKVAWYENLNGQGVFGEQRVITVRDDIKNSLANRLRIRSITTADFDGDGDLDVATSRIEWFKNQSGNGDFGARDLLSSSVNLAGKVEHGDIDNDGDLDLAIIDRTAIVWYENRNGRGDYGERQILTANENLLKEFKIADIDGDENADLIVSTMDDLAWRKNLGNGDFGERQPLEFETFFEGIQSSLTVADIDADSDPDILLSYTFDDQTISWFENLDGQGDFSVQRLIATQNDVYEIDVVAADINGDGHLDIVSESSDDEKIVWYQGDGSGAFGDQQDITFSDDDSASIAVTDIDGDGDLDVASASYYHQEVRWYANDGRGLFVMQPIIGSLEVEGSFITDLAIAAEDMDGDGDVDFILASSRHSRALELSTDQVAWYENVDGRGKFSEQRIISFRQGLGFGVASTVADLDGDGDLDLAITEYSDGRVTWYENRIAGDANNDGIFNSADLVAVFQNGEYEDQIDNNSTFDEGDWNGDGDFNSGDLVFAFQSGRYVKAAALHSFAAAIDELFRNRSKPFFIN